MVFNVCVWGNGGQSCKPKKWIKIRKNAFYQVREHQDRGAESGVEKQPEGKTTPNLCLCWFQGWKVKGWVLKARWVTAVTWKILSKDTCKAVVSNIFILPFPTSLWFTSDSLAQKNLMFIFIVLLNGMILSWKPHIYINSRMSVQRSDFTTFSASVGISPSLVKEVEIMPWCRFTPRQVLLYS